MSEWTTEPPKQHGRYWLSIAPDKRLSLRGEVEFPAVAEALIYTFSRPQPKLYFRHRNGGEWTPLDDGRFNGAKWKPVDPDPADPFAEPLPNYSQDNDLP